MAEIVAQAREFSSELGLAAAREGLAELASISDISSELDRLVEPVPAELWLAVAERAAAEQDIKLATSALDRAQGEALNEFELVAEICDRRVLLLADSDVGPSEQTEALMAAGDSRVVAGQPDAAQRHYQAALVLMPDNVQAALSVAGTEAATWLAKPIGESAAHLADIVGKLESLQAQHGVDPASAWSLLVAANVYAELASATEQSSADPLWRAVLAIARALAFDPAYTPGWVQLAQPLGMLGLYQGASFAAKRAGALDSGPRRGDDLLSVLISTAADIGDLHTMQELLPDDAGQDTAWFHAARAFVLWRLGSRAEAIGKLRLAATEDPSLLWARMLLMQAYLITGDGELARREARELTGYVGDRRDGSALGALALGALISGNLVGAERLGSELFGREGDLDEGSGLAVAGAAKLLTGRDGLDDLAESLGSACSPRVLDDWPLITRPVLEALAREREVSLPDLTPLQDVIARRRATLAARADSLAELADAPTGTADPAVVSQARAMLDVLIREAAPDPAGARAALHAAASAAHAVPEWPRLAERVLRTAVDDCLARGDLDDAAVAENERLTDTSFTGSSGRLPEIALLLCAAGRHDDAQHIIDAARQRAGPLPELTRAAGDILWHRSRRAEAAMAWESAREAGADRIEARLAAWKAGADRPAAAGLLRTAITRSYIETATDLSALPMELADRAAVIAALTEAASDPDTAPGAWVAIGVLAAAQDHPELPDNSLEVELPPSWFTGMEDPVVDSPLLARYIPEARLRLPWTLPGVVARDNAGLEPDGYRVRVLGTTFEGSNVPGRRRLRARRRRAAAFRGGAGPSDRPAVAGAGGAARRRGTGDRPGRTARHAGGRGCRPSRGGGGDGVPERPWTIPWLAVA